MQLSIGIIVSVTFQLVEEVDWADKAVISVKIVGRPSQYWRGLASGFFEFSPDGKTERGSMFLIQGPRKER